jgi:hypothetical protein
MKRKLNTISALRAFALVGVALVGLSACKKNNDTPLPLQKSKIAVLSVVDNANGLNLYVEKNKINKDSIKTALLTPYFDVDPGTNGLFLVKIGTTDTLIKKSYGFRANEANTVFLFNDGEEVGSLFTKDNLTAPASGKAKIRLVNLVPNTKKVSLFQDDSTTALVQGLEGKAAVNFLEVGTHAGTKLTVKYEGESDVLATIPTLKLEAGKIYTVFVYESGAGDQKEIKLDAAVHR